MCREKDTGHNHPPSKTLPVHPKASRAPFVSYTPYSVLGNGLVMRPEGATENQKSSGTEPGLIFGYQV